MAVFLDTNVLLYSISTARDEAAKRDKAISLLDRDDCVLSVQVLQEFYVQATRESRRDALPHETVVALIKTWMRFRIQENTLALFHSALAIKERAGFSFWDCAIIAAASLAGCRELYSEDLAHGQQVERVLILNPFH